MDRRVISLARRFVRDRRQGLGSELVRLWQRVERVVLDRRLAEASQAGVCGDDEAARERVVLDEIAELKARLRQLEAIFARFGEASDEAGRAGLPATPVVPLSFVGDSLGADHYMAPGNGFYAVEVDDAKRMYRWTGPTHEFVFDLNCDRRRPLVLQLTLLGAVQPDQCANLALLVDGEPTSLTIVQERDIWQVTFRLPARPEPEGLTNLIFITPRVFRPIDLGRGDDSRPLGVRFQALRKLG